MKLDKKYLGINQWIPESVIDNAIYEYIKFGVINKESIRVHLKEFMKGENRIGKASDYTTQIIDRNEKYLKLLGEHFGTLSYLKRPLGERRTILLCLLCLTYPVTYDLLVAMASGFKVQSSLNRAFCAQKMSALYGSNRGVYNAIGAVLPTFVEIALLKRVKVGLYEFGEKLTFLHPIVSEFVVYTDIKLSKSKSILFDDIEYRPWYQFFEINLGKHQDFRLVKFSEGRIGQGYLTI